VHLRAPSVDHGVISFFWGLALGVYVWIFLLAVGVSSAPAFVIGCLSGFVIFLAVRVYGEEQLRRD
jgi:hypothetical protein